MHPLTRDQAQGLHLPAYWIPGQNRFCPLELVYEKTVLIKRLLMPLNACKARRAHLELRIHWTEHQCSHHRMRIIAASAHMLAGVGRYLQDKWNLGFGPSLQEGVTC